MTGDATLEWKPPAAFESRPSAIEGISVFAPRPDGESTEGDVEYRCPRCGATTGFSIGESGLACDYCGYTETVDAERVGQEGAHQEFTLDVIARAQQGWGRDRRELHCSSCGTSLAYGQEDLSTTCPFCASNKVLVRPSAAKALRPGFVLPFSLEAEEAAAAARVWLGGGWMHPHQLRTAARVESMRGVYLPFWVFETGIDGLWKAEIGTKQTVRYWDSETKSYQTRTELVWNWRNGRVRNDERNVFEPASSDLPLDLLRDVLPFEVPELTTYNPDFLAGFGAQAANIELPEAWTEARRGLRLLSLKKARASIHSRHVRNFTMTADFDEERWRYVLAPVWVSALQYKGKSYRVLVNGQTGAVVGRKPVVWRRVWLAIVACFLPALCSGLLGLPLLIVGIGAILLFISAILALLGSIYAVRLHGRARALEGR